MSKAAVIVLALTNQGYWFGGQQAEVRVEPAAKVKLDGAVLQWRLLFGSKTLVSRSLQLNSAERPAVLKITPPEVRTPTTLRLVYCLYDKPTSSKQAERPEPITNGSVTIHVFPNNLLASLPKLLKHRDLVVWDERDGLPKLLTRTKIPHKRINELSDLTFRRPEMLLVAADRLNDDQPAQARLIALARAGSNILILNQSRVKSLVGFQQLNRRGAPQGKTVLKWRDRNSLSRHSTMYAELLESGTIPAFRIPAGAAVLEIAYWPAQAAVKPPVKPTATDAVLAAQKLGKGRLVLCRLPLGPWATDPRSQVFLADAVDYLVSPAEPTPPPRRRIRNPARNVRGMKRFQPAFSSVSEENRNE
jgi:hypothetical protein